MDRNKTKVWRSLAQISPDIAKTQLLYELPLPAAGAERPVGAADSHERKRPSDLDAALQAPTPIRRQSAAPPPLPAARLALHRLLSKTQVLPVEALREARERVHSRAGKLNARDVTHRIDPQLVARWRRWALWPRRRRALLAGAAVFWLAAGFASMARLRDDPSTLSARRSPQPAAATTHRRGAPRVASVVTPRVAVAPQRAASVVSPKVAAVATPRAASATMPHAASIATERAAAVLAVPLQPDAAHMPAAASHDPTWTPPAISRARPGPSTATVRTADVTPRAATDALASGDLHRAIVLYAALAVREPKQPAYARAARILDARRAQAERE